MQKATLTFSDSDDGQMHICLEFDPEVENKTNSPAVVSALRCLEYVTDLLADGK